MGEAARGGWFPPMDLFRSEPMQLVQLIIPIESAHRTVSYLGDLAILQFKDLNAEKSPFQRTYATQIKRCGEMARKLRFFKEQMLKAAVSPIGSTTLPDENIDDLEVKLTEFEFELTEMNANSEKLQRSYNELVEYKLVLQKAGEFFHSAQSRAIEHQREYESRHLSGESVETPLLQDQELSIDSSKQVKLGFLAGLVPREKSMAFERILFRATRGNVFLRQAIVDDPVTDPVSGEQVEKNVFVVFYAGEKAKAKILKICEAFGANRYPFAEELGKQSQMISEVSGRLSELKTTIDAGLQHRDNLLQTIGVQFEQWNILVRKEKSVYHTLNMLSLDVTKKCLVAEGWSPVFATKMIQDALQRAAFDSNSQVGAIFQILHTREMPPTYFRTNKFTSPFQEIIDSYGVAKYREANPAVYTIITFPFLFAVMFGDWGHGICLLLAALYFIIREKKLSSQGCYYSWPDKSASHLPIWSRPCMAWNTKRITISKLVENENVNSSWGCPNEPWNYNELLQCRILWKWLKYMWCTGSQADLYHVMIYMFLSPTDDLGENQLFGGQKILQIVLLLLAVVSVPWMLIPKPFILKKQHEDRHRGESYTPLQSTEESLQVELNHDSHGHEEFEFSEVFVHQLIHTIEFVLGAVSNTASYLRLWALRYNNVIILIVGFTIFVFATVGVLLVMETLSAFLHALRLHWVEYQNKFYEGDGYKFYPFSLSLLDDEDD